MWGPGPLPRLPRATEPDHAELHCLSFLTSLYIEVSLEGMEQTFSVPDVHCGHCKSTIEGALEPLEGVKRAAVDLDVRAVTVVYEPGAVAQEELIRAIEDSGYRVVSS